MRWAISVAVAILIGCGGGEPETPDLTPAPEVAPASEVAVLPATGQDTPSASSRLTVVYTNNIDGEIEPCG